MTNISTNLNKPTTTQYNKIESEEEHRVERSVPVYGSKSNNDARCNLKGHKDVVITPEPPAYCLIVQN